MRINDFRKGQYVTVSETPTYPKLKLKVGYIDIRDDIINKNNLDFEAREMTEKEVLSQPAFKGVTKLILDNWVKENINK